MSRFLLSLRSELGVHLFLAVVFASMCELGRAQDSKPVEYVRAKATFGLKLTNALERAVLFERRSERELLESILAESNKLDSQLAARSEPIPPEYAVAYSALSEALERLDWGPDSRQANEAELRAIHADLKLKNRYLESGMAAFPFQRSMTIQVKVVTTRNGGPVGGYSVSFNPASERERKDARYPVSSTTNNARRSLPPGIYILKLWKESFEKTIQVEIGEEGRDEQTVTIEL